MRSLLLRLTDLTLVHAVQRGTICAVVLCWVVVSGCATTPHHAEPAAGSAPVTQSGPSVEFDTKGVDFGPWIRRFIAQIKRNWFISYGAMAMKGHVVVTFYVHKDGRITELAVPGPCSVEDFNRAAYNAVVNANPVSPLPPEYPADRAFFTVTFYYNESPPKYVELACCPT